MTKRQLIDEIRRYNLTAQAPFLDQFDEAALQEYLTRLVDVSNKQVPYTRLGVIRPSKLRMVS